MKARLATMMLAAAGMTMTPIAANAASSLSLGSASLAAFQEEDDDDNGSTAVILGVVLVVLLGAAVISGNGGDPNPNSP